MRIYLNVTEQDFSNLSKLAEQQKAQRAIKIKNRMLKQTHDLKLTDGLSPITTKLEEVGKSTKNSGETLKELISGKDKNQDIVRVEIDSADDNIQSNIRALPNSNKFSSNMMEILGALINSRNSSKINTR